MFRRTNSILFTLVLAYSTYTSADNIQEQYITLNHHKIHYYQTGQGSPIILLTGFGVTSNFWSKNFINCLSIKHTLYLLDYPGVNTNEKMDKDLSIKSIASSVATFIKTLKLARPTILGWSMGGAVAIATATDFPHEIQQLILVSPLLPNEKIFLPKPPAKFSTSVNSTSAEVINYVFSYNLKDYEQNTELATYKAQILFPTKPLFIMDRNQLQIETSATTTWIAAEHNLYNIAQLPVKVILFSSHKDKILDQKVALAIAKRFKDSKIYELTNSGHAPFYQEAGYMCKIIDQQVIY
ncbi:MAG: alpha/beta fold hydrolase [Burkholderiales bacterium]